MSIKENTKTFLIREGAVVRYYNSYFGIEDTYINDGPMVFDISNFIDKEEDYDDELRTCEEDYDEMKWFIYTFKDDRRFYYITIDKEDYDTVIELPISIEQIVENYYNTMN